MYLGIDESNHGRIPEIYVGTFSKNKKYLKRDTLGKQRRTSNRNFLDLEYVHIIFSKSDFDYYGVSNFPVIAIYEFARYFSDINILSTIYIDGELKNYQYEKVTSLLEKVNPKINLIIEPNLDRYIPLVNEADNLANFLYRYYSDDYIPGDPKKNKYLDTLINTSIYDYSYLKE